MDKLRVLRLAFACGLFSTVAMLALGGAAQAAGPVVQYTVTIDAFSWNGTQYPADTFSFETPGFVVGTVPYASAYQLLAPAVYDGLTFDSIGVSGSGCCPPVYALLAPYFPNANFPPGKVGSILGFITPFLLNNGTTNGPLPVAPETLTGFPPLFAVILDNGTLTFVNGSQAITASVDVNGSISRVYVTTPEPGTWVLMVLGVFGIAVNGRLANLRRRQSRR